jgi:hypothetical protein
VLPPDKNVTISIVRPNSPVKVAGENASPDNVMRPFELPGYGSVVKSKVTCAASTGAANEAASAAAITK